MTTVQRPAQPSLRTPVPKPREEGLRTVSSSRAGQGCVSLKGDELCSLAKLCSYYWFLYLRVVSEKEDAVLRRLAF